MEGKSLKIFCNGSIAKATESRGIKWLIGAPFMPLTILSSLNCVHTVDEDPFRPNYESEAEELHWLLPKGLEVVGALLVSVEKVIDDTEKVGKVAMEMRKYFSSNDNHAVAAITAVNDKDCIEYFMYIAGASHSIKGFDNIAYEEQPSEHLWDSGCLIHCNVSLKLPLYLSSSRSLEEQLSLLHSDFLRDIEGSETVFQAEYVVGPSEKCSPVLLSLIEKEDKHSYVILNYKDHSDTNISCLKLCSSPPNMLKTSGFEIPKPIHISVLLQTSHGSLKGHAPTINYFPANEDVRQMILSIKLDTLCISSKESSLTHSISNLVIPGLSSQFCAMRKFLSPGVKRQKLNAYHFCPTGFLHPVTAVYDLCLGEMELNQVRLREKLHARLHLPLDRPMLRIANALNVHVPDSLMENSNGRKGKNRLTDVHIGLSSSGVVDGQTSLIEGTYEYYHYLQDDFDDSGWGCAYRSLQTIISWFRYQHYTPIDVPSHRKIQETLVDIGDKEPSFIGSREWIGAIELSFVLDKLLGVSCKILNVRSGAELPEKCRELALHFATQGTPVMIGGGVLAYTLLGVDYNSLTGDCAFLILDPHYTGVDDLKSIQNGGWCGWKKAVSSKGKDFFLRDKFYNLLLPQRPNMV